LAIRTARPARTLAWTWAALAASSLWGWQGYVYNRHGIAVLWRESVPWGSWHLPRALLDGGAWVHNGGLTLGAAALAVALAWILGRALPRLRPPRAPRWLPVAALVLAAITIPVALRPALWGRPAPAGPDVILISLDAVRADRLGCYGYPGGVTPSLDAWAQRAVRYTRAYCQEPWTLTSHMSMLSGLYPDAHGLADAHGLDLGRSLAPAIWTVPEVLREAGYRTWASVYDCHWLGPRFGYADGFDHYAVTDQTAADRAEAAADWLLSRKRPGFMFLHFYDPHSDTGALPYGSSEAYQERFAPDAARAFQSWKGGEGASEILRQVNEEGRPLTDEQRRQLARLYDAGLAETDAAVGIFLDRLEAAGRLDSAVVVIVADHGEALGERGHFMHEKLMEATLHVPLLVHWPGGTGAGSVVDRLTETVDLAPTLLGAAHVPARGVMQGHDLREGFSRQVAYHRSGPDYAVTSDDGWRLLYRWIDGAPEFEALRRVGEDPGDGPDVLADHPEVVDRLLDPVIDHHEANALIARQRQGARVGLTEGDRELLRSLGYID
jgi:arylsulfatase A-like enzyme